MTKPFSMVIEGFVDSEITETEFTDLCCSIGESLAFCICFPKIITEIRRFHMPDSNSPDGYSHTFTFHVVFPENRGTRNANQRFVADTMVHLLKVVLEDDLPVGLEGTVDHSGKKTYAVLRVPTGL